MPDTYAYKVRDRGGNLISGTLVADNEALVLQRLREQGLTPLEVGKQSRGFNIELTKKKVKLKELSVFSRQFATMINSGLPILRALSILADQTSNGELARVLNECRLDIEQGSSLGGDPEAPEGLQQPVRVDGQVRRDGWLTRQRLAPTRGHDRERGEASRQDQVGHDLPHRGRGARVVDHVGHAAVRGTKSIYAQLGGASLMPTRVPCPVGDLQEALVHRHCGHLRRTVLLPVVGLHT
jgi:type IV pilus assembly protein PilC